MGPILTPRTARLLLAVYWPVVLLTTHWPRLEVPEGPVAWIKPDKVIHTLAFGLLALLIVHAHLVRRRSSWPHQVMDGCLLAAAYAVFDEFTQQYFHRNTNLPDVIANLSGVFLAGGALALLKSRATPADTLADKPSHSDAHLTPSALIARLFLLIAGPVILFIVLQPGFAVGGPWPGRISQYVPFDKLMHAVAACGLTLLLLAGRWFASSGHRERLVAAGLVAFVGPVLEITQFFTRSDVEAGDIAAHLIGLMIALALWALWHPTRLSR